MSLTINTNLSSLIVQSSLTKSTNGLNQAIERMTTGFKINGAKDNAAGYSIATSMGVKLSSYDVATDNVMLGSTLVDTASSGLSLINSHLQRMRDLSEQAANGTYGEDSLNAIQSEIEARTAEINRVIANTEYNGIKLFRTNDTHSSKSMSAVSLSLYSLQSEVIVDESKRVLNQTTFQSGETYYITTSEDIIKLQDLVNSGVSTKGVTFELANDVNMQGIDFSGIGLGQDNGVRRLFEGIFHGNNHVISNLTINTTENYVGLFGNVQDATIDSVRINNCNIKGESEFSIVGGLAGSVDNSTITNCSVIGNVENIGAVGGLIGVVYNSDIINCYTKGSSQGDGEVGGLIGATTDSDIINCYSTSDVNTSLGRTGGLVGYLHNSNILNSYSSGSVTGFEECVGGLVGWGSLSNITECYSSSNVNGTYKVGGLVGEGSSLTIENSYSTGTVRGSEQQTGGLVGYMGGTISNSYSTSNVIGNEQVGGLVGCMAGIISNSYSTGYVQGNIVVGGLAGTSGGEISNSYSTGEVSGSNYVGGLAGTIDGNISNSYSTGEVSGNDNVGGFVGVAYGNPTMNGYYNVETSKQSEGVADGLYSGTVLGITSSELEQLISDGTLPKFHVDKKGCVISLQIGIDSSENSKLTFDTELSFELNIDVTNHAGALDAIAAIDSILETVNNKQTEFGAVQNRLESVTEALSINIENLTSSMSTIKDADIAEESSNYIKYQILQQASATLLATANQTPSIALQLL